MNDTTLLLRQVHPNWIQKGRVTSQAFRPTPKDESKLSTYNGDMISAPDAWNHYTTTLQLLSVGVYAVTVQECSSQSLPVHPDPQPFPEHTVIDFTGVTKADAETKSKLLRAAATCRGCQYEPEDD